MNALYSIWKPENIFSNDIVRLAKANIAPDIKVGHAGTLDPFAEGILVVCFGEKTKKVPEIMSMHKEYIGKIKLGIETDTLDRTGEVYKKGKVPSLNKEKIINVLNSFKGKTLQTPPPFSALKFNGKCLYEYARKDIRIIKKPREIEILAIDFIDHGLGYIKFKVLCGSGTYIRSLASDIAKKLGTYGYLDKLQRVRVGQYTKDNSLTLEEFLNGNIK